jgi:proteasome lid subunit RPN8/RPN11
MDSGGKEICALLLEDINGEQEIFRLPNWSNVSTAFFVAKSELQIVEHYAEREDKKILAFIHSHHSSPQISQADRRGLKYSKYPWVVVCLGPTGLEVKNYKAL